MSLLVANYGSDSESDSDNEQPKQQKTQSTLASSLPPPKRKADNASGKVQIFVDLPKVTDDDDNSEDDIKAPTIKRPKTSSSGSGLLASLLPAPKNAAPSKKQTDSASTAANAQVKSTSFIPPAIAKRKAELQAAAKRTEEAKVKNDVQKDDVGDDESDQDEQDSGDDDTANAPVTSFFPLGSNIIKPFASTSQSIETEEPEANQTSESQAVEEPAVTYTAADAYAYYDPNEQYDPAAYQQWYEQQAAYAQYEEQLQNTAQSEDQLSGEALERLMGRHGRGGIPNNINIQTVNLAEELQSQDGIPAEEPVRHSGSSIKISGIQKRKSNIMFLAHQAQDRRDILAEQYAQNKRTKREAKQKYGKEGKGREGD
ncbi:hypothetical protein NQZ79_g1986 [Umbelopsis isabellina]|nr:hypothetical protein NQZ79_g1986 [Umbelopsis isabellina]